MIKTQEVTEYKNVWMTPMFADTTVKFDLAINKLITEGWQPLGPVTMTDKGGMWVQTMVKTTKVEQRNG